MGFILDSLTGREWQNASRKCPSKWESCDQFSPFFHAYGALMPMSEKMGHVMQFATLSL